MLKQTLDQFANTLIIETQQRYQLDPSRSPQHHALEFARTVHAHTCAVGSLFASSNCRAGCWHCCTLYVSTLPIEAELIAQQIKTMPTKIIDETMTRIVVNAELEQLGVDEYIRRRTPCAFLNLKSRMCRIYTNRPMTCRSYDSQNVSRCVEAIGDPDKGTPRTLELVQLSAQMNIAFEVMLEHFGMTYHTEALHTGVLNHLNAGK